MPADLQKDPSPRDQLRALIRELSVPDRNKDFLLGGVQNMGDEDAARELVKFRRTVADLKAGVKSLEH